MRGAALRSTFPVQGLTWELDQLICLAWKLGQILKWSRGRAGTLGRSYIIVFSTCPSPWHPPDCLVWQVRS